MSFSTITRIVIVTASGLAASGCTVNPAPVITGAQSLDQPIETIQLAYPQADQPEAPLRARFARELADALTKRGAAITADGQLFAEFAISAQPSEIVLSEPATQEKPGRQASQLSRKPRWWDKCKVQKIRGSLALFDHNSGALSAKSEGEYFACTGDMSGVAELAALLVENALSRR